MLDPHLVTYFEQREAMERRLAGEATNPVVRDIHTMMAGSYARILERGEVALEQPAFGFSHVVSESEAMAQGSPPVISTPTSQAA